MLRWNTVHRVVFQGRWIDYWWQRTFFSYGNMLTKWNWIRQTMQSKLNCNFDVESLDVFINWNDISNKGPNLSTSMIKSTNRLFFWFEIGETNHFPFSFVDFNGKESQYQCAMKPFEYELIWLKLACGML